MPFPFVLPTTSSVILADHFSSVTHPTLPVTATTKRSIVRDALKKHKRLADRDQAAHLPAVQNALLGYIPYLLALNRASSFQDVGKESIELQIKNPLEVEWRTTLTASLPGREPPRPKLTGLHNEIAFVLTTLAYVYTLMARSQLWTVADSANTTLSDEQRTTAITTAMKHLLESHSIHNHLTTLVPTETASNPLDINPTTLAALAALSLAEANLTFLSKDDPYLTHAAKDRNTSNKEWIYVPPSIPKVRATLYARIALAAHEHTHPASALPAQTTPDLRLYANNLSAVTRARACRFLGIDADLSSQTGTAIAWLHAARHFLTSSPDSSSSSNTNNSNNAGTGSSSGATSKLSSLKHSILEKREDRKISKNQFNKWGLDAGKFEELRVVNSLLEKWERENRSFNVQVVPGWEGLVAGKMPSGRNAWNDLKGWEAPVLGEREWEALRAPLGPEERVFRGEEDDSGDEAGVPFAGGAASGGRGPQHGVGAFPTERSETSNAYY